MIDKYPTLHELGLGPQLDSLERLALKGRGPHPEDDFAVRSSFREHVGHARDHLDEADYGLPRDADTEELNTIHAALRSLMAAHCVEFERGNKETKA